jgi:ADP-ribose pyrophosphatase
VDRLLANFTDTPPLRSNEHAASYLRTQAPPKRSDRQKEAIRKFLSREGNENIQSTLRAHDKPTPDIKELDGMMVPLEHDLVLSRVVGPDAFGLRGEDMAGVEEWNGQKLMDYGFSPYNIGDAYQIAGPHIEMRVLVPKGTPALIVGGDGNSADDARTVILPRELPTQNIKIQDDGRGGWYAMSVVAPEQGSGKVARGLAGRPLPARDKSPAIEATPDELERRGISPEEAGVPAPQEQPGRFGPATPAPGAGQQVLPQAAPTAQSIPNPAAGPPGDAPVPEGVAQPAKAIKKAQGQIPVGAGGVPEEGVEPTPRGKMPSRSARGVATPESQAAEDAKTRAAADKEAKAREDRRVAAEEVMARREEHIARRETQVAEQQAQINDLQAQQIGQQQELIDRLMQTPPAAGGGSEGGTRAAGLSPAQKRAVKGRFRPEGTSDEDRRQQELVRQIDAEEAAAAGTGGDGVPAPTKAAGAPAAPPAPPAKKGIKKAAKKAAPEAAEAAREAPGTGGGEAEQAPEDITLEQVRAYGDADRAAIADVKDEEFPALTPEEATDVERLSPEQEEVYWARRAAGAIHTRAMRGLGPQPGARKKAAAARLAPGARRRNFIGRQVRGEQLKELRPGDVVEVPSTRGGKGVQQKTVRAVDDDGTLIFTDNERFGRDRGSVKVVSQGKLKPSAAAQGKARRLSDRVAAGLSTDETIKAVRDGRITPEQAANNLDSKIYGYRKQQLQLGDNAPPELTRVIDALVKMRADLRGEGTPSADEAKKTTAAVKRATKKVAADREISGEEVPLEAVRQTPALKKAAAKSIKKTAAAAGPDLVDADRPDAANVNAVRQAKSLGDVNAVAGRLGVRIPATVGRREDRRAFLEKALSMQDGESKADYDARITELGKAPTGPVRGRPRKARPGAPETVAPETPAAAPAKKASRLARKAAPVAEAPPAKKAAKKVVAAPEGPKPVKARKGAAPAKVTKAAKATPEAPAKKVAAKAPAKAIKKAAPVKAAKAAPEKPTITRATPLAKMSDDDVLAEAGRIEGAPETPRQRAVARRAAAINTRRERTQAREQVQAARASEAEARKATAEAKKEAAAARLDAANARKEAAAAKKTAAAAKKAAPEKKAAAPAKKVAKAATTKVVKKASAPEKAAPAKKVAKAAPERPVKVLRKGAVKKAPASAFDRADAMSRLQNFENPPSREEAGALLENASRADLVAMAKEISVPGASRKTSPELRREVVEATAGRRLDSIAIRGFRGKRPGQRAPEERSVRRVKAPVEDAGIGRREIAPIPGAVRRPGLANPSASAIKRGDRIMVTRNADGQWVRTMNKGGAVPLTVDSVERALAGNQTGYVFHGKTDDGKDISTAPVFGQNVFKRAPEKVAAPAVAKKAPAKAIKKAAPAAPEKPTVTAKKTAKAAPGGLLQRVVADLEQDKQDRAAAKKAPAKKVPAKAIKKAAPEKPVITRAAPVSKMDDDAVVAEAAKIEGAPSTPRERAVSRKAGLISARRERGAAKAAKAPAKKATKALAEPKKPMAGYRDTGEVVPEADREGLHVSPQKWGGYGVYDGKQDRVEADYKTEATARRRVRELQAGDTVKAIIPKERTARQQAADKKEADRQNALARAAGRGSEVEAPAAKKAPAKKAAAPTPLDEDERLLGPALSRVTRAQRAQGIPDDKILTNPADAKAGMYVYWSPSNRFNKLVRPRTRPGKGWHVEDGNPQYLGSLPQAQVDSAVAEYNRMADQIKAARKKVPAKAVKKAVPEKAVPEKVAPAKVTKVAPAKEVVAKAVPGKATVAKAAPEKPVIKRASKKAPATRGITEAEKKAPPTPVGAARPEAAAATVRPAASWTPGSGMDTSLYLSLQQSLGKAKVKNLNTLDRETRVASRHQNVPAAYQALRADLAGSPDLQDRLDRWYRSTFKPAGGKDKDLTRSLRRGVTVEDAPRTPRKVMPSTPAADAKIRATVKGLSPELQKELLDSMTPEQRKAVQDAIDRVDVKLAARKVTKAAKAAPEAPAPAKAARKVTRKATTEAVPAAPAKKASIKKAPAKAAAPERPVKVTRRGEAESPTAAARRERAERRAQRPALESKERKAAKAEVARKAKATDARIAAERKVEDKAHADFIRPILKDAGVKRSDLSDLDQTGLRVVSDKLRAGRISKATAARRLRTDRDSPLNKIADAIEAKPRKAAVKKAAPEAPTKAAKAPAKVIKKTATKAAPGRPVKVTRRADEKAAAIEAPAKAAKAPAKAIKKAAVAKKAAPEAAPAAKLTRAPKGVDSKLVDDLTPDQVAQINDLSPDSQDQYWGRRVTRGIGHDSAWRSVPKGDVEALRVPSQEPRTPSPARGPGDAAAVEALRRPTIGRRGTGSQRLTEDEKDSIIRQAADAKAANPNFPVTREDQDLAREAAEIQEARGSTTKAVKATKKVAPREVVKKVAPNVVKTRERRAKQYDEAVGDVPGDRGGLLRSTKKALAEGEPAATAKKRLGDRAESLRTQAELLREKGNSDVLGQEIAKLERDADTYQRAADLAGKRVVPVKKAVRPGEKVAVKDLEDGDVAVLDGKKGVFRQPKPRTTFIEFPDGSQEKVQKSRLASMVREKRLALTGGPQRTGVPEAEVPAAAKKARPSIKRPPATAAAETPGNVGDRRRLDALGDRRDMAKARADELVQDGKTSPAAWRQALDEVGALPEERSVRRRLTGPVGGEGNVDTSLESRRAKKAVRTVTPGGESQVVPLKRGAKKAAAPEVEAPAAKKATKKVAAARPERPVKVTKAAETRAAKKAAKAAPAAPAGPTPQEARRAAQAEARRVREDARRQAREAREAVSAGRASERQKKYGPGGPSHIDMAQVGDIRNVDVTDEQADLNNGKTPTEVAKKLDFRARGTKNSAAIIDGGWDNEANQRRLADDPEYYGPLLRAQRERYEEGIARGDRLQELADKLRATRRPVARKAVAKKAAPEAPAPTKATKAARKAAPAAPAKVAKVAAKKAAPEAPAKVAKKVAAKAPAKAPAKAIKKAAPAEVPVHERPDVKAVTDRLPEVHQDQIRRMLTGDYRVAKNRRSQASALRKQAAFRRNSADSSLRQNPNLQRVRDEHARDMAIADHYDRVADLIYPKPGSTPSRKKLPDVQETLASKVNAAAKIMGNSPADEPVRKALDSGDNSNVVSVRSRAQDLRDGAKRMRAAGVLRRRSKDKDERELGLRQVAAAKEMETAAGAFDAHADTIPEARATKQLAAEVRRTDLVQRREQARFDRRRQQGIGAGLDEAEADDFARGASTIGQWRRRNAPVPEKKAVPAKAAKKVAKKAPAEAPERPVKVIRRAKKATAAEAPPERPVRRSSKAVPDAESATPAKKAPAKAAGNVQLDRDLDVWEKTRIKIEDHLGKLRAQREKSGDTTPSADEQRSARALGRAIKRIDGLKAEKASVAKKAPAKAIKKVAPSAPAAKKAVPAKKTVPLKKAAPEAPARAAKKAAPEKPTITRKATKAAAPAATPRRTAAQKIAGSRKSRVEAPEGYDRKTVPVSKASWGIKYPDYKPNRFTADVVKKNDETLRPPGNTDPTKYWADPPNVKDVKREFRSYEGPVKLDAEGRPQNPYTRTGVQDRGELGKWGANFAGDAIVTRVDPETGRLQMLTIRRKDGQPAIPGGMVDFNEDIWKTRRRELKEETGVDLDLADSKEIYKGYVDDPRNTDNAWMETSVGHKHLSPEEGARTDKFRPDSEDEIKGVYWADVDPDMMDGLFASHGDFVATMAEQMASDRGLSLAERRRLRSAVRTRAARKVAAPKKKVLSKAAVKALPDQPDQPTAAKATKAAKAPAKAIKKAAPTTAEAAPAKKAVPPTKRTLGQNMANLRAATTPEEADAALDKLTENQLWWIRQELKTATEKQGSSWTRAHSRRAIVEKLFPAKKAAPEKPTITRRATKAAAPEGPAKATKGLRRAGSNDEAPGRLDAEEARDRLEAELTVRQRGQVDSLSTLQDKEDYWTRRANGESHLKAWSGRTGRPAAKKAAAPVAAETPAVKKAARSIKKTAAEVAPEAPVKKTAAKKAARKAIPEKLPTGAAALVRLGQEQGILGAGDLSPEALRSALEAKRRDPNLVPISTELIPDVIKSADTKKLRAIAKVGNLGELEGDTPDALREDLLRKAIVKAARERLEGPPAKKAIRKATKAAPAKAAKKTAKAAPEAPTETVRKVRAADSMSDVDKVLADKDLQQLRAIAKADDTPGVTTRDSRASIRQKIRQAEEARRSHKVLQRLGHRGLDEKAVGSTWSRNVVKDANKDLARGESNEDVAASLRGRAEELRSEGLNDGDFPDRVHRDDDDRREVAGTEARRLEEMADSLDPPERSVRRGGPTPEPAAAKKAAKKVAPTKAVKATKAAPIKKVAAKKAAEPAEKFLPALADGTQRKSLTNVKVGDTVRVGNNLGDLGVPQRVTKVERDGNGVKLTRADGSVISGNNNTAVWLGDKLRPGERSGSRATKAAAKAVPARPTITRAAKKAATAPEAEVPATPAKRTTRLAKKVAPEAPKSDLTARQKSEASNLTPAQRPGYDKLTDEQKDLYWPYRGTRSHAAAVRDAKAYTRLSQGIKDLDEAESYDAARASLKKYSDNDLGDMLRRDRGRPLGSRFPSDMNREELETATVNTYIGEKARKRLTAEREGREGAVNSVVDDLNAKKIDKREAVRQLRDLDTAESRELADGLEESGDLEAASFRDLKSGDTIIDTDGDLRKIASVDNATVLDGDGNRINPRFLDRSRVLRTHRAPEAPTPAKKVTVRKAVPRATTVQKNLLDADGPEGRRQVMDALHDDLSVVQWRKLAKDLGAGTQRGSKQDSRDAIERHMASGEGSVPKKNLRDQLRDADVNVGHRDSQESVEDRRYIERASAVAKDDPDKLRREADEFVRTAGVRRGLANDIEADGDDNAERVRLLREGADNYDKAAKVFRSRADTIDKGRVAAGKKVAAKAAPEAPAKKAVSLKKAAAPAKAAPEKPTIKRAAKKAAPESTPEAPAKKGASAKVAAKAAPERPTIKRAAAKKMAGTPSAEDVARERGIDAERKYGRRLLSGQRAQVDAMTPATRTKYWNRVADGKDHADAIDDLPYSRRTGNAITGPIAEDSPQIIGNAREQRALDGMERYEARLTPRQKLQLRDLDDEQKLDYWNRREGRESHTNAYKRVASGEESTPTAAKKTTPLKKAAPEKKATPAKATKAEPAKKALTREEADRRELEARKTAAEERAAEAKAEAKAAPPVKKAAVRRVRLTPSQTALLRRVEADGHLDNDAELTTQEKRDRNRLRLHGLLRMDSVKRGNKKVLRDSVTDDGRAELARADAPTPAKKTVAKAAKVAPEAPAKKTAPAKKAAPDLPAATKATPSTPVKAAPSKVTTPSTPATTARDRLDSRQKEARIRKASGAIDLADNMLSAVEAFRNGDNADGFRRAVGQDLKGPTPGDVGNPRDTRAAGWVALKKAMGPESGWDTPDKLDAKLRDALKDMGIRVDHNHGDRLAFDPDSMDTFDGAQVNPGDEVTVIKPGLSYRDTDGSLHVLRRPTVTRRRGGDTDTGPLAPDGGPADGNPFGDVSLPRRSEMTVADGGVDLLRDLKGEKAFRNDWGIDRADRLMRRMQKRELQSMAKYLDVRLVPGQRQNSIRHDVMRDIRRRLGMPAPRAREREELELLSTDELRKRLPAGAKPPSGATRRDLVEIALGDGPVVDHHVGPLQPGARRVREAVQGGTKDLKYFSSGSMGQVAHVEGADGKEAIRKQMSRTDGVSGKQQADSEQILSELGERIDAPQAPVYRPAEDVVYMGFLPGSSANKMGDARVRAAVATPQGRRVAILDAITGNSDRHPGNFKIIDGKPVGFDNSLAFDREGGRGRDFGPDGEILPGGTHSMDPFEQHYPYRTKELYPNSDIVKGGQWLDQHPFPREELLDVRRELEAMKPQFDRLGREAWYDQAHQRLEALIKRARPASELGIAPEERSVARTRVPSVPPTPGRRPDLSGTSGPPILTGRQGVDASDMGPPGDTPPGGMPVKDFTLRSGYNIQHGTFFRQDRIPYLIEHEDTPEGKAHAEEIQKALWAHRQSLPLSMRGLQRSYSWVRGRNPKDGERARRLGHDPDDFISGATSDSLGGVTVYNRDEFGFDGVDGELDHEFAHSLDHVGKELGGIGSGSDEWLDAVIADGIHREGLSDVTFDQGPADTHSPIRLRPASDKYEFPYGVTDYGTADAPEDFAESFRLYRAGPIGKGRRTKGGPIEPLWFRDVFPARAAIFDQIVPDSAEKQLREIDQARGTDVSVAQRRELIKRLIKERDNSDRAVAFRRLAKTAPTRSSMRSTLSPEDQAFIDRHVAEERAGVRPISGTIPEGGSVAEFFGDSIGPEGMDVNDLILDQHDYTIPQGRVWRDGNDVFVVEGTDPARMRREMETVRDEVRRLPRELSQSTRAFVVADGNSPPAVARLRAAGISDQFLPFASANSVGNGSDITFWDRGRRGPLEGDSQFQPTLRHETSHNSDVALGNVSASSEWRRAAERGTKGTKVRGFTQRKIKGQGALQPPGKAKGAKFPLGVTPYATSSVREDWAEAAEFYFGTERYGGVVGTGVVGGKRVPIWFRDLFPARAAVLDKYFPEFAAQQLAEIRRIRG